MVKRHDRRSVLFAEIMTQQDGQMDRRADSQGSQVYLLLCSEELMHCEKDFTGG